MVQRAPDQVVDEVRSSPLDKVKVAVTDIDGVLRGKYIHKNKFLAALEGGFGFCDVVFGWDCGDVCYDNVKVTGWHTGYPDAEVRLDLGTYRTIPWDGQVPFFLGDFHKGAGPLEVCPRQLLKKIVHELQADGYHAKVGFEFEWFNFRETPDSLAAKGGHSPTPLSPGMFGYSVLRSSLNRDFFAALMDQSNAFGVPLEGLHTETGPGVYEAALLIADPVEAADRAVLFKTAAKEIGYRHGVMASFMAKWNAQLPGCGGHMHQSLWSAGGAGLFHDPARPHRMSPLFEHYLAGQMHCVSHLLPMYAPTVNSYKRLTEGMWAPTRVAWGADNRTTAFRVIPGSPKSTRLETRVAGADMNPYLALAAAMASGLYGIRHKLKLDSPVRGSAYLARDLQRLPRDLGEATEAMAQSDIARDLFGEAFVDHFVNTRRWEWRQYQAAVTDWELKRYFEII